MIKMGWAGADWLAWASGISRWARSLRARSRATRSRACFACQKSGALINRMGFPGRGAEFVARRLQRPAAAGLVLGVNLGKNKDTPLEEAAE